MKNLNPDLVSFNIFKKIHPRWARGSMVDMLFWLFYGEHASLIVLWLTCYFDRSMVNMLFWLFYDEHAILIVLWWTCYFNCSMVNMLFWLFYSEQAILIVLWWPCYFDFQQNNLAVLFYILDIKYMHKHKCYNNHINIVCCFRAFLTHKRVKHNIE